MYPQLPQGAATLQVWPGTGIATPSQVDVSCPPVVLHPAQWQPRPSFRTGGAEPTGKVHDLLSGPSRGGMLGDVEVQDPTPMVSEDDQDEEHPQLSGGNGEEVDRD